MGGRGSTRWRGHTKRPLVEKALAVDLVALHRAGLYERPGTMLPLTWARDEAVLAAGQVRLVVGDEDNRCLDVEIAVSGVPDALSMRLELVAFRPSLGGTRWYLRCPEDSCGRRALRLYVSPEADRIGCRQCLRLIHRTDQQHDARLDEARRDPRGFAASRQRLPGLWSGVVTARLAMSALEASAARRRGWGWGVRSTTAWSRALDEMLSEVMASPSS
jgi:hypothetical protein